MVANVAMTKKGFGEMAITGCIAGPIFNVLIGIGLSTVLGILGSKDPYTATVKFSLYSLKENGLIVFNPVSVLPLTLLVSQLLIMALILINGCINHYNISYKWT
jgi:Ca2+/Na+ antiporter